MMAVQIWRGLGRTGRLWPAPLHRNDLWCAPISTRFYELIDALSAKGVKF